MYFYFCFFVKKRKNRKSSLFGKWKNNEIQNTTCKVFFFSKIHLFQRVFFFFFEQTTAAADSYVDLHCVARNINLTTTLTTY